MKQTFTWVSLCHDDPHVFLDSNNPFYETVEGCYNGMREAVLSKMTWNTNFKEDLDDDGIVIRYHVFFRKDMIVHRSFSGDYIYLIVDPDKIPSPDYVYGRLAEFLEVKAYEHHNGF